ncbi:MAG: rhomboid family intramembrane serine protease [Saprospiraceae bacterium]|nr:rhomboid family intramembrane serine protease [Saprospiraceae bacterium]
MQEQKQRILRSLRLPLKFMAVMWGVFMVEVIFDLDFGAYGVFPREVLGLRGILFAPLVHDNFQHLISNSAPMFVLSFIIMYFYRRVAFRSIMMIYLLTGFAVWLFARKVFHIGASGVVYGLLSFVFWSGIFRRSLKSIILALIVTVLYSGYLGGILPNQEGISWESHLLGALVGVFTAYWYKEEIEADEKAQPPSWEGENSEASFFLNRDVFDKTKAEREAE